MSAPQRFAALRVRDYRRYFLVALLSTMADNIEHVISYWVMFQAFHSRALGGFRLSASSRNLSVVLIALGLLAREPGRLDVGSRRP